MLPSDSNDKLTQSQEQFTLEDIQRAMKVWEMFDKHSPIKGIPTRVVRNFQKVEKTVAEILRDEYGQNRVEMRIHCGVGIIDILTEDYICEVKTLLDRASIFQAVGQVLLYRECIKPYRIPIIAGVIGKNELVLKWEQYLSNIGIGLITLDYQYPLEDKTDNERKIDSAGIDLSS